MTSSLVNLAQQTEEHASTLAMPAYMFGLIAFGILLLMLLVTLAYRNVHTRHR